MASLAEWLKTLTPEQNQFVARLVASLPESEGGLGLPLQNTAHVAALNPSKIRSKYAAFNPWRTNESNLLASHPLATALGSATLAKMLGAGQNIDLRQSINDKLSKSADPLGLYSRYGMEAPYSYGDVAQQALGATDLYAPIAAGEAIEAAKKGEWKKSGLSALGALPIIGAIKASHGSPHAFTKFDFSKIGTGEGAQAYGHGGYFAQGFDSPVANMYADALGSKNQDLVNSAIDRVVQIHGGDAAKIKSELLNAGLSTERITPELEASIARIVRGTDPSDGSVSSSALKEYESLQNLVPNEKHLYNVELRWPDPAREAADPLGMEHFLDWYQPFSQQPDNVKDAVIKALHNDAYKASQSEPKAFNPESEPSWMADLFSGDTPKFNPSDYYDLYRSRTGEQIYKTLAERLGGAKEASALLRESGLPGLRYQDEKSRYLPYSQGTHNFVMFDDALANIVSRNGVSLSDLLKTSESPQNKLDAIIQNLESQGIKIDASYNPNKQQISLSRLVVPQEMRSQGVGTKAMQDLVNFADEQNALMQLSPSTDFGATSLNRLKDFYKRFGFVPNTGKYKDYSISESMYRPKR